MTSQEIKNLPDHELNFLLNEDKGNAYCSDLNQMAVLESGLKGIALTIYDNLLYAVVGKSVSAMKFAKARQRAEAYYATQLALKELPTN